MASRDSKSSTRPIAPTEQPLRNWTVAVDGVPVPAPSVVEISSRFGVLRYGWLPDGYDGWSFREAGGGGAVSVPYAFRDGELLIGVVEQHRTNQGGTVLNVPRGFLDPGEAHAATAARELDEETALGARRVRELPGRPLNPNSAFFETPEPELGVRIYAVEIPGDELVASGTDWALSSEGVEHASPGADARARERIGALRFVRWTDAAALGDMFTVAATARLLAELRRTGRWM